MRNVLRLAILGLATTSLINCTDAADPVPVDDDDGTQIDRDDGRPLTPPSADPPAAIVRSYLGGHVAGDQLRVIGESTSRGVTHVRFEQVVDGLRVYGAYAKAALSSRGELLQVIHRIAPTSSKTTKLIPAQAIESDALRTALIEYGYGIEPARVASRGNVTSFARTAELHRAPSVERVAYRDGLALRVGFLVETWSQDNNQLDHTLIGGDGRIVTAERRTQNDSYNVFVEDPGKGDQTLTSGPGAGNAESPSGWLGAGVQTTVNISGNNVRGYLDSDANNIADSGGTAVTGGNFVTEIDLAVAPTTSGNKAGAVQNLFYLNNVVHDLLYRHGFVEAEGNFQANNFGKGGAGNDPVNAEAQDGSGTDNANFATPSDGSSPRMQMYLWTGAAASALVTVNGVDTDAYQSSFGGALNTAVSGQLAIANDGAEPSGDACTAIPAGQLNGKIAIVDRGTCDFTVKVLNAQKAGAVGVIIANNVSGAAFAPGGTNRKVTIPSAMVSLGDGDDLKEQVGAGASLKKNNVVASQIDASLDADIVAHEYGHGLTWRMVGGMSGPLAGAIGEGASDVVAFLMNGDPVIAEYSASSAAGIRRHSYANYPLTYSAVTGASVHDDGEIYAGAMYAVMQNYLAAGFSVDDVFSDFVEGLRLTPSTPKMENMRDAMVQGSPGRACQIWQGFASKGIGQGAKATLKGSRVTITQSFTVPANVCP